MIERFVRAIHLRFTRRAFITAAGISASGLTAARKSSAQVRPAPELPHPDPKRFEAGDFVWPKKPGAYVPYNSGTGNSPQKDREQWTIERDAYIQKHADDSSSDQGAQQRLEILRTLEYREFLALYEGAQELGLPGVYSGGSVYVGHVGIIEVTQDKTPWVIEALGSRGVIRTTYSDWIRDRSDEVVWLGRLRQIAPEQRAKVADEAKKYLSKPYAFWNFDLNDDAGFYCSKLAWLSIYRSLGFAVDGNTRSKRVLWFSPKQFLYLPTIERLHDPGPYAVA